MTFTCRAVLLSSLLLIEEIRDPITDPCLVAPEHGTIAFPVEHLTSEARCLLSEVIDRPSASGVIGPNRTPISLDLYGYLLDHPALTARLMERLGIGSFQITEEGAHRYRIDDGDGAEGILWIVSEDLHHRIYYIDGQHRSRLFPTIRAKTAAFLHVRTVTNVQGRPSVETVLISYTRFEDGMLARVLHLFKPLVTRAVNAALAKEFNMTHRLGLLIVEQPHQVVDAAQALDYTSSDDRQAFLHLLQGELSSSNPSGIIR